MENTLRVIETEDIIIYKEFCYGPEVIKECRDFFKEMNKKGVVKGRFEDEKWICYSGVKNFEINFAFSAKEYQNNLGKEFGISYETMEAMLKCYACYCTGEYIFRTIAADIVNAIKNFICKCNASAISLTQAELYKIEDFLAFINTPAKDIDRVTKNLRKIRVHNSGARKLSPLINYLVIENEVNEMFASGIIDDDFIRFFPIYFWVNVTFILPLRATEMLVTPFDCMEIDDDRVILRVRRTKLKGGHKRVYYDVDKDYELFTYSLDGIIKKQVFNNIKMYQEMTSSHTRRFLFDYGEVFSNHMMSLSGFNNLLKVFIDERIVGNPKYEFARSVCGISEFEYVTAGDSRPIAMANLYFQDAGADICRQLANHMNVTTSEGYFTNVSETLYYSSIMQMQSKINNDYLKERQYSSEIVIKDKYNCSSPKRLKDETSVEDCQPAHYFSCFGCHYYHPSNSEIQNEMDSRKQEHLKNIKKMQAVLKSTSKIKGKDIDMDELFLKVHTSSTRYKESTDVYVEEEAKKWLEQRNTQMISC